MEGHGQVTIYTAVLGGIADTLRKPVCLQDDRFKFVCFSDRAFQDRGPWEVRSPVRVEADARRTARWHKVNAHLLFPGQTTIWLDGCLELRVDALRILEDADTANAAMATFKHPQRHCVYDEYRACVRLRKDSIDRMIAQMDYYRFLGYPLGNGLAETSCLVRRSDLGEFNSIWWDLISAYSVRDQLSFDFAAWRVKMLYRHLEGNRLRSPYFNFHHHYTRKKK